MVNHIKSGFKVTMGYVMSLVVFVVFMYMFLSITKDNFYKWLPLYSFINFVILFLIVYSDIKKLAAKEKKPQYGLNPYPLKGFVLGLIGFAPIILIELIYPLIVLEGETPNRIKHVILNTFMGPLYFIVRLGGGTTLAYAAASLVVPLISMLAYLAGYYGFELKKTLRKLSGKNEPVETGPKFTKSPWNPTVSTPAKGKGKKKQQSK